MLQLASSAPGCAAPWQGRSRAPRRVRAQALGGVSASSRPAVRARAATPRLACSTPAGGAVHGSGRPLGRARRGSVCEAWGGDYNDSPTAAERVVAALPYLLPLLDGLRYGAQVSQASACSGGGAAGVDASPCVPAGKFFFLEFPQTQLLFLPLQPILQLYTTVPFASVLVFFGLYLGIVQNQNYSRFVRFNGQQAILLDILLILPSLLESLFRPPTSGFGLTVFVSLYNTVWLYVAISFLYTVGACLLGKKVLLPLVGEGADQQVM